MDAEVRWHVTEDGKVAELSGDISYKPRGEIH